ncbi:hypothetical protein ACKI1I_35760 [Streptomyces turgidiscabies]|uniref:hypothetical protein n=1 Tax=Streptomyces turgidiscabies TaxID=85558 RepID=UPI0038F6964F
MAKNIKRTKAIGALRKAGASHENAVRIIRHGYLDLEEPFGPQIEEIAEDFPQYFESATDTDDKPADDTEPSDDKPMTTMERKIARLKGTDNPYVYKGEPRAERPPTASKSAQKNAEHLRSHSKTAPPPSRKWIEPVRDINAGHTPRTNEPSTRAQEIAAKLRGN